MVTIFATKAALRRERSISSHKFEDPEMSGAG